MKLRTKELTEENLKKKGYVFISRVKADSKIIDYYEYWLKNERTTIIEFMRNGEILFYKDIERIA